MRSSHTIVREEFWKLVNELLEEARAIANDSRPKDEQFRTIRSYVESYGKTIVGYYDTIRKGIAAEEDPGLKEGAWRSFRSSVFDVKGLDLGKLRKLDTVFKNKYLAANNWAIRLRKNRRRLSFDILRDTLPLRTLRDRDRFVEWLGSFNEHGFVLKGYAIADGLVRYKNDFALDNSEMQLRRAFVYYLSGMGGLEELEEVAARDSFHRIHEIVQSFQSESEEENSFHAPAALGLLVSLGFAIVRVFGEEVDAQTVMRGLQINAKVVDCLSKEISDEASRRIRRIVVEDLKVGERVWLTDLLCRWMESAMRSQYFRFWRYMNGIEIPSDLANRGDQRELEFWRKGEWIRSYVSDSRVSESSADVRLSVMLACLTGNVSDVNLGGQLLNRLLVELKSVNNVRVASVADFYEGCGLFCEGTGYGFAATEAYECVAAAYAVTGLTGQMEILEKRKAGRRRQRLVPLRGNVPVHIEAILDEIENRSLLKVLMK